MKLAVLIQRLVPKNGKLLPTKVNNSEATYLLMHTKTVNVGCPVVYKIRLRSVKCWKVLFNIFLGSYFISEEPKTDNYSLVVQK